MVTRFVLTYAYCDWDINGCIGVYDDPDKVMGRIIDEALYIWDQSGPNLTSGYTDPEFKFVFHHDSANDNYYDVEITYPWAKDGEHDVYRVYYLREDNDGQDDLDKRRT